MRSKRPPALSFLLRMATAAALGARALAARARLRRRGARDLHGAGAQGGGARPRATRARPSTRRRRILAFAYLVTALLFARSGLYAERAQRPGLSRIVGALFQVAFVALLFAVVSGEHFQSYYIFCGSLGFALLYVSSLRGAYEWLTGALLRAAGYRRRAVLVGTGKHIRDVAHALADAPHSPIEVVGFLSPTALPANGLRSLGSLGAAAERARHRTDRRGDHRRPGLPPGRGRGAGRPLPPARGARADRAVDDGDPDPPRRVRAGPVGAAVRAELAGLRGRRLRAQAHLRPGRRDAAAGAAEPAAAGDRARREAVLARAGRVPLDAPGDRAAAVCVPEVPHDAHRRRAAPGGPGRAQRGLGRAVQDPRRPAHDARRAHCCAATRWTSCRSW